VNEQVRPGRLPCEIAGYVAQYGLRPRPYESPPFVEPLRFLLANGIAVIVNQLLESGSDIAHYRVVKRYDDASQEYVTDDPLQRKGSDICLGYDESAKFSNHGAFVPVYRPEKASLVRSSMKKLHVLAAGSDGPVPGLRMVRAAEASPAHQPGVSFRVGARKWPRRPCSP
jgi:hypothetical protein